MIYTGADHQHCKLMLPTPTGDIIMKNVEQWDDETKQAVILITQDGKCLQSEGHMIRATVHLPTAYIVERIKFKIVEDETHPDLY